VSPGKLINLNINLVKNKIDSYFGGVNTLENKGQRLDRMKLEVQRGELISKKIEDKLSKLMVTCEAQIKKPCNEVQTQT
jgi:hypothetical protein